MQPMPSPGPPPDRLRGRLALCRADVPMRHLKYMGSAHGMAFRSMGYGTVIVFCVRAGAQLLRKACAQSAWPVLA